MKIGFLFDDYSHYQLLHAAPIAFALSRDYPAAEVFLVTSMEATANILRRLSRQYPGQRCRYLSATVPRALECLDPLLRTITFARKPAIRRCNVALFREFDILVTPELSSVALRDVPELGHLRFVYTHHGAGDRAATFNGLLRRFDLVLAAGRKLYNRLVGEEWVHPDRCAVVGYPKFELAGALGAQPPQFPEARPTVLYNPHFARGESSWQKMGRKVLETFRKQDDYNLIFAPHTRLYQRALRQGARPLGRYKRCPHIHLDTGSEASIDMTYTMAADIYLGDTSSQVYEFLHRPRPCVFLDAHAVTNWREPPSYRYWHAGEILCAADAVLPAIARAQTRHAAYRQVQEQLVAETFDKQAIPASSRAAEAIGELAGLPAIRRAG